jgi:hypothetical protein
MYFPAILHPKILYSILKVRIKTITGHTFPAILNPIIIARSILLSPAISTTTF